MNVILFVTNIILMYDIVISTSEMKSEYRWNNIKDIPLSTLASKS